MRVCLLSCDAKFLKCTFSDKDVGHKRRPLQCFTVQIRPHKACNACVVKHFIDAAFCYILFHILMHSSGAFCNNTYIVVFFAGRTGIMHLNVFFSMQIVGCKAKFCNVYLGTILHSAKS